MLCKRGSAGYKVNSWFAGRSAHSGSNYISGFSSVNILYAIYFNSLWSCFTELFGYCGQPVRGWIGRVSNQCCQHHLQGLHPFICFTHTHTCARTRTHTHAHKQKWEILSHFSIIIKLIIGLQRGNNVCDPQYCWASYTDIHSKSFLILPSAYFTY